MIGASGRHGDYGWLAAAEVPRLIEKIISHHRDARLCVTSFDSGPFTPSREEIDLGWAHVGSLAISPPLTESFAIPTAGFDEWYIFDRVPAPTFMPEVFVNYVPFPVQRALPGNIDADHLDDGDQWFADAQARFWRQIAIARPISYVARADSDIAVSRHGAFVEDLRQ